MRRKIVSAMLISLFAGLFLPACQRVAPPSDQINETGITSPSSGVTAVSTAEKTSETVRPTALPSLSESASESETEPTAETETAETSEAMPESEETTSEEETETSMNGETLPSSLPSESSPATETSPSTSEREPSWIDIIGGHGQGNQAGSLSNPHELGDVAYFDGYDTLFDPFRAEVSVQQIFRGNAALQMVKDASNLNPAPKPGKEYLVAQVLVKILASKNSETVGVNPYYFSLAREDGRMYGDVTLFRSITPVLSTLNVGETSIGYVCYELDKNDERPYIVFLSRAHGGIWFKAYESESEETKMDYSGK